MQPIRAEKYFEALFGFPEKDYETAKRMLLSMCSCEVGRGRERCLFTLSTTTTTTATGQTQLSSGWHYVPSVSELRQEVRRALDSFEARHPGYLAKVRSHFAERTPPDLDGTKIPFTAVSSLRMAHVLGVSGQQHLQYPGALFQAASQFNLLEFISPTVVPEAGIADYVFDATQGPDCALACFAGTAYRNYLIHPDFVHDGELSSFQSEVLHQTDQCQKPRPPLSAEELNAKRGQRANWQVDTLQDITRFLTGMRGGREGHADVPGIPYDSFYRIENGYFSVSGNRVDGLPERVGLLASFFDTSVSALLDRMSDMLRIGVVEDATVTNGLLHAAGGHDDDDEDSDPGTKATAMAGRQAPMHTVWQTYNSALSLSGRQYAEGTAIPMLAKCILNGSYEATLLAGVHRTLHYLDEVCDEKGEAVLPEQLPPVFLTKVGGGVFHNKPAWIRGAIERAMDRVGPLGVPLDLRLVHFRQLEPSYLPSER